MPKLIYIWGVPMVDWLNITAHEEDNGREFYRSMSDPSQRLHVSAQLGGSLLLEKLLVHMVPLEMVGVASNINPNDSDYTVEPSDDDVDKEANKWQPLLQKWIREKQWTKEKQGTEAFDIVTHNWTSWKKVEGVSGEQHRWKLAHWNDCEIGLFVSGKGAVQTNNANQNRYFGDYDLGEDIGVLVIDDRGWSASAHDTPALCNKFLDSIKQSHTPKEIILNLANNGNSLQSPTIRALSSAGLLAHTTIITTIEELRLHNTSVGASLSWESMMSNVVAAVHECVLDNNFLNQYIKRMVVVADLCGAIVIEFDHKVAKAEVVKAELIFDRFGQETDFRVKHKNGVLGYLTCMLATLASDLSLKQAEADTQYNPWKNAEFDWADSVKRGLGLMRLLHREGYDEVTSDRPILAFPFQAMEREYQYLKYKRNLKYKRDYSDTDLCIYRKWTKDKANNWTILQDSLSVNMQNLPVDRGIVSFKERIAMFDIGIRIVAEGAKRGLNNVPIEQVGRWISADRSEIEGVRSVRNAIANYLRQRQEKPIAIAVFGPPGAGKSFVVKEIAREAKIPDKAVLEFNLSQYETPEDLTRAFHAIRDANLRGVTPLVFWDEFDTSLDKIALGWLRYFLAPMQDGAFTEKGAIHPIGPGIHVFAGGTSPSYSKFIAGHAPTETKKRTLSVA